MARRKKFKPIHGAAYMTMGRRVYLGRVSPRVRRNALQAGLTPVSAKEWRKEFNDMQAIQRISGQGEWHDTVKY